MKPLKQVWYTEIVTIGEDQKVKRHNDCFNSQTEVLRYFNTYKPRGSQKVISMGATMEMGIDI